MLSATASPPSVTGEYAGKWLAEIAYPDWAAYGRITEALAADAQWQKDMAGLTTLSTLEFRMLMVELDLWQSDLNDRRHITFSNT